MIYDQFFRSLGVRDIATLAGWEWGGGGGCGAAGAGHLQDACSATFCSGDPGLVSCHLGYSLSSPVKWRPWCCPDGKVK